MIYICRLYKNDGTDEVREDGINYGSEKILVIADDDEAACDKAITYWGDAATQEDVGVGTELLLIDGTDQPAMLIC